MIMTNELKEQCTALQNAAGALQAAAGKPDDIETLRSAREKVANAADVLDDMVANVASLRERQTANLESERALLRRAADDVRYAGSPDEQTRAKKEIQRLVDCSVFPNEVAALVIRLLDFPNSNVGRTWMFGSDDNFDKLLHELAASELRNFQVLRSATLRQRLLELTKPAGRL